MYFLSFIWNPSRSLLNLNLGFTEISLRYYSLMYIVAFSLGYYLMQRIFIRENKNLEKLEPLFLYTAIGTLLGARLGHCLFYDWEYYKFHLSEIILPFRFSPEFQFTGFEGMASHGAALGIIVATLWYVKKFPEFSLSWTFDRIVIPITIGGMFIRLGNFMNSEINGKIVDKSFAFAVQFLQGGDFSIKHALQLTGETLPQKAFETIQHNPNLSYILTMIPYRHPAQLYEAICYFFLFWALFFIYFKTQKRNQPYFIFGFFLIALWGIRFVVEFVKESQGGWLEEHLGLLSTGQWLSIPFIILGFYLILKNRKNEKV